MRLERVLETDAEELLGIYGYYVTDTAVSFEYEIPKVEEFRRRIANISSKYPYIKAVDDNGNILGYSYAGVFKSRKAYDWAVETTVYVSRNHKKEGIGRALYETLEQELIKMGILNMNACIACPREEDEYLTMDSCHFHEKMGFVSVGTFHNIGYKFNRWYDMVWMEKSLGEHLNNQPEVRFNSANIR